MRGAIPPVSQYVFMAWCPVKKKDRDNFTLERNKFFYSGNNIECELLNLLIQGHGILPFAARSPLP
jgi:hypothetical protein